MSIANLLIFFSAENESMVEFMGRDLAFQKFSKRNQIPFDLNRRVRSFYEQQYKMLDGLDEAKVSFY